MPRNINSALKDGDIDAVLEASDAKFAALWISIANHIIPPNSRRIADAEDIRQETLLELQKKIESEEGTFRNKTETDIKRWTADVVRKKSLQAAERASKMKGPSAVRPVAASEDREVADLGSVPTEEAGPCEAAAASEMKGKESQVLSDIAALESEIENALSTHDENDTAIIRLFLSGFGNRRVANELSKAGDRIVKEHYVRRKTFHFTQETLKASVTQLRQLLMEVENDRPGIARRIDIPGSVARCLTDFRENP